MIKLIKKFTPKITTTWYFDFWFLVIIFPFVLRVFGALVELLTGITKVTLIANDLIRDIDVLLDGFYLIIAIICMLLTIALMFLEKIKS